MADYLTGLAKRTLGLLPVAQPLITPSFSTFALRMNNRPEISFNDNVGLFDQQVIPGSQEQEVPQAEPGSKVQMTARSKQALPMEQAEHFVKGNVNNSLLYPKKSGSENQDESQPETKFISQDGGSIRESVPIGNKVSPEYTGIVKEEMYDPPDISFNDNVELPDQKIISGTQEVPHAESKPKVQTAGQSRHEPSLEKPGHYFVDIANYSLLPHKEADNQEIDPEINFINQDKTKPELVHINKQVPSKDTGIVTGEMSEELESVTLPGQAPKNLKNSWVRKNPEIMGSGIENEITGSTTGKEKKGSRIDNELMGSRIENEITGSMNGKEKKGSRIDNELMGSRIENEITGSTTGKEKTGSRIDNELMGSRIENEIAGSMNGKEKTGSRIDNELMGSGIENEITGSTNGKEKKGSRIDNELMGSGIKNEITGSMNGKEKKGSRIINELMGSRIANEIAGSTTGKEKTGSRIDNELMGSGIANEIVGSMNGKEKSGSRIINELMGSRIANEIAGSMNRKEKSGSRIENEMIGSGIKNEIVGSMNRKEMKSIDGPVLTGRADPFSEKYGEGRIHQDRILDFKTESQRSIDIFSESHTTKKPSLIRKSNLNKKPNIESSGHDLNPGYPATPDILHEREKLILSETFIEKERSVVKKPEHYEMAGKTGFKNVINPVINISHEGKDHAIKDNHTNIQQPPTIKVTIGRVEVRAIPSQPVIHPTPPLKKPALSLDEYLKQHNG